MGTGPDQDTPWSRQERLAHGLLAAARKGDEAQTERIAGELGPLGMMEMSAKLAVQEAARGGHAGCLRILGKWGGDPNWRSAEGMAAARYVAMGDWQSTPGVWGPSMEALLGMGLDVSQEDQMTKREAGHLAAISGNAEAMKVLLAHGWDPNREDAWGYTAGHLAALDGHEGIIEELILSGRWDERARGQNGETAEEMARREGHVGMAERIKSFREAKEMGAEVMQAKSPGKMEGRML